ncbi:MAG: methylenetetrahydrofolate reductase [NAD(P)H] [Bacteroidota bacterium]|nr:methylenetetrahydrofolate reductase [NAD(P)H] [Bacteroidota bacterium]
MQFCEYIKKHDNPFVTFEILPPLKGQSINLLFDILEQLMEFNPPFVNVTYHRSEYVYKKRENGFLEKVSVRKRPGTVGICASIMHRFNINSVPHLICGGFTKQETEDALIDLHYIGIDNILALRGDPPKNEREFIPEPDGNNYAIDLIRQIKNMNNGIYLEEDLKNPLKTNFCIGVAGYPEKHFEAPNMHYDMKFLKAKVDAGADYIVTQMFFDNKKYFDFVNNCRSMGINVPIIPGLKPVTTKKMAQTLPKVFHVEIPEEFYNEIDKCKNDSEVTEAGIEWAVKQSRELLEFGVPSLHYFTLETSKAVAEIVRKVF